jgi:hypothetical protein
MGRRRHVARRWAWALVLFAGCARNPVGPARDAGSYAAKAVRSAESALSAVSTVQLVAEAGGDGKVFGTYASVAVDQQEDAVTETAALFRSIQPPDDASRELRDELGPLLDASRDHIAAVRIEVRRGHLDAAAQAATALEADADALQSFAEANE